MYYCFTDELPFRLHYVACALQNKWHIFWNRFYMNNTTNLPWAFSMTLMTSESLEDALGSATFSRAFILFFWSFNSNSTLKNPAQYNTMDKTEIMEAKEGELCFWAVIFVISTIRTSVQSNVCWILFQPDMWYSHHERGWYGNVYPIYIPSHDMRHKVQIRLGKFS